MDMAADELLGPGFASIAQRAVRDSRRNGWLLADQTKGTEGFERAGMDDGRTASTNPAILPGDVHLLHQIESRRCRMHLNNI